MAGVGSTVGMERRQEELASYIGTVFDRGMGRNVGRSLEREDIAILRF